MSRYSVSRFNQFANELRNDVRYEYRRWRARSEMPTLSQRDRTIVDRLKHIGAVVTSLSELGIDGSEEILAAGDILTGRLRQRQVPQGKFTISAGAEEIEAQPALIRWGLDERLLSIVTNYIGMDVAYRGLTVRRDIVGGPRNETRMWHRDNEDNRIVKVIVYLNAIDEDDGPFEFVPRHLTPSGWRVPIVDSSRVSEIEMRRLVPEEEWCPCTGPRGTIVIVDTCRVFHRGRIASREDRRTLFYCYNSQQPINPQWCQPLFNVQSFEAVTTDLSQCQRKAIHFAY